MEVTEVEPAPPATAGQVAELPASLEAVAGAPAAPRRAFDTGDGPGIWY